MSGHTLLRLAVGCATLVLVSCSDSSSSDTIDPPPATEAEMASFCEAYEEVREQSWSEMTASLIDVSPLEIKVQMVRTSEPPGETWAEDREAVEEFIARCDDR